MSNVGYYMYCTLIRYAYLRDLHNNRGMVSHMYVSRQMRDSHLTYNQTKDSLPLEGTHGYTVGDIPTCRGTLRSVSSQSVLEGRIEL